MPTTTPIMPFWSKERLIAENDKRGPFVTDWNEDAIQCGAYELSLGPEVYISSFELQRKKNFESGEQLSIPSGQFALLTSKESVRIPDNAIGLISIKARFKWHGLINVSGFHVDPGFDGNLKFSVYNAGPNEVTLQSGDPVFLIWFASLDKKTKDLYSGEHQGQSGLKANDLNAMSGTIASPGALSDRIDETERTLLKRVDELENKLGTFKIFAAAVATALIGLLLRSCFASPTNSSSPLSVSTTNLVTHTNQIHMDEFSRVVSATVSNQLWMARQATKETGVSLPGTNDANVKPPGKTN